MSQTLEPLNIKVNDGFFDCEYKSSKTNPEIYSISLGIVEVMGIFC